MSERLVIRLGSNDGDSIHWLQFNDKAQEVIASGTLNSAEELSQLAQQAAAATVQVLVPGSDVSYFEVDVPKNNRRQAIAAIPFMLEDELASDIDTLHFVYGAVVDSRQSVYVCDKLTIARWVDWLSQAGISATQLLPDYLAVPVAQEPEHISALQLDNQLLFRLNSNQGLCVNQQWLNVTLEKLRGDDESLSIEHYDVQSDNQLLPINGWHNH